ncbi:uncharacterized protein [Arachis hypogaea]|uniref:uncharacterized protein isoform X2 n=1 Tax=Arachis hypogaea TaxID=3818 RepID=UPI003B22490C
MGLAGTVPQFSHSFRSCPILVNIVVIVLAASAVAGKTLPPPLSPKIAAESSVLLRVAVVLVTDCGVGVAETATSAAATWFPPCCCVYSEGGLELRLRLSVISG